MSTHETDLPVGHQFEDAEQQLDAYSAGMWLFLVTEILFFGGLFLAYIIYRTRYTEAFVAAHHELDWRMGALNTLVLITSSLTMALAVRAAVIDRWKQVLGWMAATFVLAGCFMVVKYFEYSAKFEHHLFPGPNFEFHHPGIDSGQAEMFFNLYFAMTGLHGAHVLIGMITMIILAIRLYVMRNQRTDFIPVELAGLYWHFVDLVWIFLFPLFYLVGGN
jgi:cytochrome c oxidase subunit 3